MLERRPSCDDRVINSVISPEPRRTRAFRSRMALHKVPPVSIRPVLLYIKLSLATQKIVDWFIPSSARSTQTNWELARTFVFTHLFGPLIAQPLWIYLYHIHPEGRYHVFTLAAAICAFWTLPFLVRVTGNIWIPSLLSFEGLSITTLYGSYHYGGSISPFMPWLVVSLLLGLFYLSRNTTLVLTLFTVNLATFLVMLWYAPLKYQLSQEALRTLGWLSVSSATLYMSWMAHYYSKVVSLQHELEAEADRSRSTSQELEHARAVAEATDKARSRFFATMSHELRTPLHIIIGYSDMLLHDNPAEAPFDEQCIQDVNRINTAGKHLLSLVSGVLNSDKLKDVALDTVTKPFQLGGLCDDIVATALPMISKKNNKLVVSCSERQFELYSDPQKLRQIAINLLSNAGKFTSAGTVRLSLDIHRGSHDHLLYLTVTDDGIGISADLLPRVFSDYEQGEASDEANFGGTGIGLALSRRFANLLGGEITVVSAPGSGSRFTVTVPARLESARVPTCSYLTASR